MADKMKAYKVTTTNVETFTHYVMAESQEKALEIFQEEAGNNFSMFDNPETFESNDEVVEIPEDEVQSNLLVSPCDELIEL